MAHTATFLLFQLLLSTITKWVVAFDVACFKLVNSVFTHPYLDATLPIWRDSIFWTPLYLFFIAFGLMQFGKKAWLWILFGILTVTITDQVSSTIIKHWVARLRPCSDPEMQPYVRLLLTHCSGGYSFTSSHATNHFGIATFFHITLRHCLPTKWLFAWAASIAYAQVYVGVHYPLDVVGGTILGLLLGNMVASFYCRRFPFQTQIG